MIWILMSSLNLAFLCTLTKLSLKLVGLPNFLSIPAILKLANALSLGVKSVIYTRGRFIFPRAQPSPHRSFSEEVSVFDNHFGKLGLVSKAYVMGSPEKSQKWHVYSASAELGSQSKPVYTFEMFVIGLDRKRASVFYKTHGSSAALMTEDSGIRKILPQSEICDFEFDPCGYSMNGIEGSAISTIHVTPEDGFSYAGFEAAGYDFEDVNLTQLLERVLACFQPTEFSVAVHTDIAGRELGKNFPLDLNGYHCGHKSHEVLGSGGSVTYQNFDRAESCGSPRSILKCCWSKDEKEVEEEF
ncbi:S-adenosylmethionine decarboxylase proenzyme [Morella rubra]|uniref:S-adenosylmethionine decarboxylase proenzyme n=1 Tax=Morella rubra TaxID=262757 RepID=A0A6A1WPU3_9ROSI|nr:S-adenosylmethionine decarboxylase proenzyme [Morella rubra]